MSLKSQKTKAESSIRKKGKESKPDHVAVPNFAQQRRNFINEQQDYEVIKMILKKHKEMFW